MEEAIENCKLKADNFSVYPNPARSYFTVHAPSSVSNIKIYDVSGKVVKEIRDCFSSARNNKSTEIRVSLKGINPGVYFIQAGDKIINKKLVITK